MFACVKVGKSRFAGHPGAVLLRSLILHGETVETAAGRQGHVAEMISVQLVA